MLPALIVPTIDGAAGTVRAAGAPGPHLRHLQLPLRARPRRAPEPRRAPPPAADPPSPVAARLQVERIRATAAAAALERRREEHAARRPPPPPPPESKLESTLAAASVAEEPQRSSLRVERLALEAARPESPPEGAVVRPALATRVLPSAAALSAGARRVDVSAQQHLAWFIAAPDGELTRLAALLGVPAASVSQVHAAESVRDAKMLVAWGWLPGLELVCNRRPLCASPSVPALANLALAPGSAMEGLVVVGSAGLLGRMDAFHACPHVCQRVYVPVWTDMNSAVSGVALDCIWALAYTALPQWTLSVPRRMPVPLQMQLQAALACTGRQLSPAYCVHVLALGDSADTRETHRPQQATKEQPAKLTVRIHIGQSPWEAGGCVDSTSTCGRTGFTMVTLILGEGGGIRTHIASTNFYAQKR
jgi:hypothetical protein